MAKNEIVIDEDGDRVIRTAADADDLREEIEAVFDGWYSDGGPIDWYDFIDRLERTGKYDFGTDMLSDAIRRVKAIVRELRKQQQ